MKFLKQFRSKSKLKTPSHSSYDNAPRSPLWYPTGHDYTNKLDERLLKRIFSFVCPHSVDDTYESCEQSMVGDGCMLCDLRDLANCSVVKRSWARPALELLYHSIRIDAVHYCELEEYYTEKRRRRSFRNRYGDHPDIPGLRLKMLADTLKRNHHLARQVNLLKLPYMTRETCKPDLARCLSVCPNLVYVDLPDGCFTGDSGCHLLLQELQENCRHLRRMKYAAGSEAYLDRLVAGRWDGLEVLQLTALRIEPSLLRRVLGSLSQLRELRCEELPWLGDEIFHDSTHLPPFPALHKLVLTETPRITAEGLVLYLSSTRARAYLTSLSLSATGIPITDLHRVLWAASSLEQLAVNETVTHSLPIDPIPPLASITLRSLTFEITSSLDVPHTSLHAPSTSYYNYLTSSLQTNSLPALRTLYVRDQDFPEQLTLAPPVRPFAPDQHSSNPFASPTGGFSQSLEVYTKGLDEQEWVFTSVTPSAVPGRRGSMTGGRPLSAYSAHRGLGPQWGGEARKSIIVGNGFGGFLAVPAEPERPRTSSGGSMKGGITGSGGGFGSFAPPPAPGGEKSGRGSWWGGERERRGSRADLWR